MLMLIIFRAVAGIGAAAIFSMVKKNQNQKHFHFPLTFLHFRYLLLSPI